MGSLGVLSKAGEEERHVDCSFFLSPLSLTQRGGNLTWEAQKRIGNQWGMVGIWGMSAKQQNKRGNRGLVARIVHAALFPLKPAAGLWGAGLMFVLWGLPTPPHHKTSGSVEIQDNSFLENARNKKIENIISPYIFPTSDECGRIRMNPSKK